MTVPLWCLLGFTAWTLAIAVFGVAAVRVSKVLTGQARPNEFPADQPHGSPLYRRTMRAHANCVENLPVFAAVVLTAAVTGVDTPLLDALAVLYLGARVGQTVAHVSSGRNLVINVRFGFFVVQLVAVTAMGVLVARANL